METILLEHQSQRAYAFNHVYADFLKSMIIGKQKHIRFRKWFFNRLKAYAVTLFEMEEEEDNAIRYYGAGIWMRDFINKAFSFDEVIIVKNIAEDYGAFRNY